MSAIENCRSAILGGHVERCEDCGHSRIAYNSCRNRHCPKCQGAAARWALPTPPSSRRGRVFPRLFRRLFLAALTDAQAAGRLAFFGDIEGLRRRQSFAAHLAPLKRKDWFVYAKPPFAGPEAVLA